MEIVEQVGIPVEECPVIFFTSHKQKVPYP